MGSPAKLAASVGGGEVAGRRRSPAAPRVLLLGEIQIWRGDQSMPLPASKKTRALLGYLAAEARPHLRERLCELLWDGPDDPRAALRWSLTKIRPLLDSASCTVVNADRERVTLDGAACEVDWQALRAELAGGVEAAHEAVLRRAARRFRGEFLDGLDLPDCQRFHAWAMAERERARALRLAVLGALASRLEARPDEALAYALERVAIDPLSEAGHADVVGLLGRLGRGRDALRHYETSRRMLEGEIGARPSGLLEAARRAISAAPARAEPPPSASSTRPPVPQPAELFFDAATAGRDDELRAIDANLEATVASASPGLLVWTGEPGIGKSRLLDELVGRVRARGGLALRGRAFEAEMVRPYGPWIDALRSVGASPTQAGWRGLSPLLPELGPAPADSGDRSRLFDAVAALLAELCHGRPLLAVVLDDLHWFDEVSLALLHFLGRRVQGLPVIFACAARPGELFDNPAALRVVRALSREHRLVDVPLGPLSQAATASLVGAGVSDVDEAQVFAASAGNPLFALEVARALRSGRSAAESLDGLLQERLADMQGPARELLPWMAALGRDFDPEVLGRVTGLGAGLLLTALDELERRGLLRGGVGPSGRSAYDFAHDLIRQAAYRGMSEPRRRLVHMQIARTLAGMDDDALAGELAHHAALGGDPQVAVSASIRAGERCIRLFAREEAVALAERGRRYLPGLPDEARVRGHAGLLKVQVFACWGEAGVLALDDELAEVEREATTLGLLAEVRLVHFMRSCIHLQKGDYTRAAEDALRGVDAGRVADPATAVEALANGGYCLALVGRELGQAEAMLAEAEALSRMAGVPPHLDLDPGLGLVRHFQGRLGEARQHLERGLALIQRSSDHWRACVCQARLVMIALEQGSPAEAGARCREFHAVAARMRESSEAPFARCLDALAGVALDGAAAAPRAALEAALAELRSVDNKGALAYAQNFAAHLDLARGDVASARTRAEEASRAAAALNQPSELALSQAVLAQLDARSGEGDTGRSRLGPALAQSAAPGLLSARAVSAVAAAAHALHISVPTGVTTLPPTTAP